MRIHLIAVGQKMPGWVTQGFQEYIKRLPAETELRLVEIAAGQRGKNTDIKRVMQQEGQRMLAAIPKDALVIALEVEGDAWGTETLSRQLQEWMQCGRDVALLVGGPDGLAKECLDKAQKKWSLSKLTLPHALVRIVVAEQVYRAWSILNNHPYHRV